MFLCVYVYMCLCVHVSMSPCVHVSICLCLHVSYLHVSLFASPDVGYCAVLLQPFPGEHVHLVWPQLGGWQKRPPHPLAPVYQSSLVLGIGSLQLSPLNQTAVRVISLNRSQIRSQALKTQFTVTDLEVVCVHLDLGD